MRKLKSHSNKNILLKLLSLILVSYNINSYPSNLERSHQIVPSLGVASLVCYIHKEYQDKKGVCDVKVGYYKPSGELEKMKGDLYIWRDGLYKGRRIYLYSFVLENGNEIDGAVLIKKPLHLCDKDGWWVRQTGAIGYEAVLCKDGKIKRDYQIIFKGLEMSPTSAYSTYLLKFGNPSGSDSPMAPQFLYNVAAFDQECNSKIIGKKFEPLDEVSKRIEKKCKGKDVYFYICGKRGLDVLCYPRSDPTAAFW